MQDYSGTGFDIMGHIYIVNLLKDDCAVMLFTSPANPEVGKPITAYLDYEGDVDLVL